MQCVDYKQADSEITTTGNRAISTNSCPVFLAYLYNNNYGYLMLEIATT